MSIEGVGDGRMGHNRQEVNAFWTFWEIRHGCEDIQHTSHTVFEDIRQV